MGYRGMEVKVNFVNQYYRIGNLLSNKLIQNWKNGLLTCGHFNNIVGTMTIIEQKVEIWSGWGVNTGHRFYPGERTSREDSFIKIL